MEHVLRPVGPVFATCLRDLDPDMHSQSRVEASSITPYCIWLVNNATQILRLVIGRATATF